MPLQLHWDTCIKVSYVFNRETSTGRSMSTAWPLRVRGGVLCLKSGRESQPILKLRCDLTTDTSTSSRVASKYIRNAEFLRNKLDLLNKRIGIREKSNVTQSPICLLQKCQLDTFPWHTFFNDRSFTFWWLHRVDKGSLHLRVLFYFILFFGFLRSSNPTSETFFAQFN